MKQRLILLLSIVLSAGMAAGSNRGVIDTSESPHAKLRSVDLEAVTWTQGFWGDRFELVRRTGLPRLWEVMQDSRNFANFVNLQIAAGLVQGKYHGINWNDAEVFKTIETMAAVYARTRDVGGARP